jgi:hypothetical protein
MEQVTGLLSPSFHGHTLPDASRWNGMDFFCMETYTPTENYD